MAQGTRQDANTGNGKPRCEPVRQPGDPDPNCTAMPKPPLPPCYKPPAKCDPCCTCPPTTSEPPLCFEDLIKIEADAASRGDQAKKFKADLEALMGKVKASTLEYTVDAFDDLLERWKQEDESIVCLIRSIHCALPCWQCVIECEICPLISDIVRLESKLSGETKSCPKDEDDGTQDTKPCGSDSASDTAGSGTPTDPPKVETITSVYDIRQYWWREKIRRQALFDHVSGVMKAWETPFKTLDGALKANAEIIKNTMPLLGVDQKKDASKLLFDVFFRLIPMHLAIAPTANVATTKIAKKYTEFCCCDNSDPLHCCCGVVIRLPTVRDRIIGPQPYLIEPSKYATLMCCLAKNVFQPAKQQASEAESKYTEYDTEAKAAEAAIAAQLKSLAADAKLRLSKTIECGSYYVPKSGKDGATHTCCGDGDPSPPPANDPKTPADDTGHPTQQNPIPARSA